MIPYHTIAFMFLLSWVLRGNVLPLGLVPVTSSTSKCFATGLGARHRHKREAMVERAAAA